MDNTISRRDFGEMLGVAGALAGTHLKQPAAGPQGFLGWHCMSNQAIQTLPRASESGITSIIIEQRADLGIGWQHLVDALCYYDFLPSAKRGGEKRDLVTAFRRHYRNVTEEAAKRDIDVYVMAPEITLEAGLLSGRGGTLDIDDPFFEYFMQQRMREVYRALPKLAGFVLYLTESSYRDVTDLPSSRLNDVQKTRKLIEAELRVAKEFGRRLIVTTFIHSPKKLEIVAEALRSMNPDPSLQVLQYSCPSDWGVLAIPNPTIGRVGKHPEIMCFDYCGENWGQGSIPFCQVHYMFEQWNRAAGLGVDLVGTNGYTSWFDKTCLGTLNEVNVAAGKALAAGSQQGPDQFLDSWIEERFGPDTTPYLAPALKASFDVVFKAYHLKGFWVDTGQKSDLADLEELNNYLWGDFFGVSLATWSDKDEYAATWQKIYRPTEAAVAEFLAEKDEAIEQARESLSLIARGKTTFRPQQYDEVSSDFELELSVARTCRAYADVFLHYRLWQNRNKPGALAREVSKRLQTLRAEAARIESSYGSQAFPINPTRLISIAASIEESLG